MTAAEVTQHAAKVYLNDAAQALFTDAVLLPYVAQAALEFEGHCRVNEIPLEVRVSNIVTVEIGDTELDEYPVDFIEPLSLKERPLGSSDSWSRDITEVQDVDPNAITSDSVNQWAFRNNKIYINPPTTDREIRLLYVGSLTAITTTGSTVDLISAKSFLAARAAQLCAKNGGNNPTKAAEMQPDVDEAKDLLIRGLVKNNQTSGAGRRGAYKGRKK